MIPIVESAEALLDKARRCRRLARNTLDRQTVEALTATAAECEARATELVAVLKRAGA